MGNVPPKERLRECIERIKESKNEIEKEQIWTEIWKLEKIAISDLNVSLPLSLCGSVLSSVSSAAEQQSFFPISSQYASDLNTIVQLPELIESAHNIDPIDHASVDEIVLLDETLDSPSIHSSYILVQHFMRQCIEHLESESKQMLLDFTLNRDSSSGTISPSASNACFIILRFLPLLFSAPPLRIPLPSSFSLSDLNNFDFSSSSSSSSSSLNHSEIGVSFSDALFWGSSISDVPCLGSRLIDSLFRFLNLPHLCT